MFFIQHYNNIEIVFSEYFLTLNSNISLKYFLILELHCTHILTIRYFKP